MKSLWIIILALAGAVTAPAETEAPAEMDAPAESAVATEAPASATTNAVEAVQLSSGNTNKAAVAEAVEAMSVVEMDEAEEAREVAETVKKTSATTNQPAASIEGPRLVIPGLIKMPPPEKPPVDPWVAFMPPADTEFDWVQLTSGEWLKGELKVLYDYKLEFDSDELDLLEIDFEDVQRIRTRGMKTLFIQGDGGRRDTAVLRGMLEVDGDQVTLRRSEYEVVIDRDKVISIAGGRQKELDNWSGMLSVGITARGGNTETIDTTVMANLKRRTASTRFGLDYLANYSQSGSIETANNQRLNGNYDRFLTARFFWQLISGEYYRDPFSNIDSQYSLGTGVGYDIIHNTKTEWALGVGVGYQNQRYVSVEVGADDQSSSPFATLGTRFDHEVTGNFDFLYDYSLRILNEENGLYTHHMLTQLSFDLIRDLDLDVSLIWDRTEKPQQAADGTTPAKDDYQLIVSLAYDF